MMRGDKMNPLVVSEDILPLGEFKARAARILKDLPGRRNPLVITQNGRPACVVMSPGEFDRMRERQAFLEAVAQGLADVQAGWVISDEELRKQLDAEFGPRHHGGLWSPPRLARDRPLHRQGRSRCGAQVGRASAATCAPGCGTSQGWSNRARARSAPAA